MQLWCNRPAETSCQKAAYNWEVEGKPCMVLNVISDKLYQNFFILEITSVQLYQLLCESIMWFVGGQWTHSIIKTTGYIKTGRSGWKLWWSLKRGYFRKQFPKLWTFHGGLFGPSKKMTQLLTYQAQGWPPKLTGWVRSSHEAHCGTGGAGVIQKLRWEDVLTGKTPQIWPLRMSGKKKFTVETHWKSHPVYMIPVTIFTWTTWKRRRNGQEYLQLWEGMVRLCYFWTFCFRVMGYLLPKPQENALTVAILTWQNMNKIKRVYKNKKMKTISWKSVQNCVTHFRK